MKYFQKHFKATGRPPTSIQLWRLLYFAYFLLNTYFSIPVRHIGTSRLNKLSAEKIVQNSMICGIKVLRCCTKSHDFVPNFVPNHTILYGPCRGLSKLIHTWSQNDPDQLVCIIHVGTRYESSETVLLVDFSWAFGSQMMFLISKLCWSQRHTFAPERTYILSTRTAVLVY